VRRRDFIALLGAAAAVWPLAARGEQPEKRPRVGVLNSIARTVPLAQEWDTAFHKRFHELGWIDGRNVHLDYRWGDGKVDRMRMLAKELVALKPDVLVAMTTPATAALQAETRAIPIVFAAVSDPVGSGFVASLPKPGGNVTGFIDIEASLSGKWLDLLRRIAPSVTHVAFMFNPQTAPFAHYYLETFRSAAAAMAIEPIEAPVHNTSDVAAFMKELGPKGDAGVIVMPDTSSGSYFETIRSSAARYRLPTIYPFRLFAADGGLMSYGVDYRNLLYGAAAYADRILHGAKPQDLPVQLPTKFELVINLKTAKALGLTVPPTLLATADEVIE
jgi:ABC-type uncharacterized transport system substrate-binding protein